MRKAIVGINISHNSSACVVDERGEVIFASAEERFSRIKNDTGFPRLTLKYILSEVVAPSEVSAVTVGDLCLGSYSSNSFAEFLYINNMAAKNRVFKNPFKAMQLLQSEMSSRLQSPLKSDYKALVRGEIEKLMPQVPVSFLDHHLAHAASAYYCSPFKDALVMTLDGSGNEASGLVMSGAGHQLKELYRLPESHSVGNYYKSMVALLGFMPGSHEGKITGLAAYGDSSRFYEKFQKLLFLITDGEGQLSFRSLCGEVTDQGFALSNINPFSLVKNHLVDYFKSPTWDEFRRRGLNRHFIKLYKNLIDLDIHSLTSFKDRADLSAAGQAVFEDVIVKYIKHHVDQSAAKNLAVAGGVFANVKLNQKIFENAGIENMYVHPAMGDEGLSVGAAKFRYHYQTKEAPIYLRDVFIGAKDSDVSSVVKKYKIKAQALSAKELCQKTVDALSEEKIVALYNSATEYGPRALGNRTLLVNPKNKDVNDVVNKKLKRTEFMPFAPVILEEDFSEIFDLSKTKAPLETARFMTMTFNVKDEYKGKMPAVVHVDGTARPQLINSRTHGLYYEILKNFKAQSGIPALVNTSFNMHEEPIVNSPEDAVRAFIDGAIDHLVLENMWCSRSVPEN